MKRKPMTLKQARGLIAQRDAKTPTEILKWCGLGSDRYERNLSAIAEAELVIEQSEKVH